MFLLSGAAWGAGGAYNNVYVYNSICSIPMVRGEANVPVTLYWSYCRHSNPAGGSLLAVQTRGPYNVLVSLLLCDARWMHLGEWNAACSGLFKGVAMLRHLKWQEPGRDFCQIKTMILVLTWSYNWIILWYLSCHHKLRTLLYPDLHTNDPVSLYSVTQWSHICII